MRIKRLREENKYMKEQMETKIVMLYHEYFLIFAFQIELEKQKQFARNGILTSIYSDPDAITMT